jgi:3-oxoadipate enol-lactonase
MIREAHVSVDGRRMRYLHAGAGWPVVLIHAFPLNADMWRPQLERVPDGWQIIAPDVRGFGPGADPPDLSRALTLDDVASDVAQLLDHLEIDRAVIGGLSMGGYATFAVFRLAAERVGGMILADTKAQPDTPEGREGRRRMIELARAGGASAVADEMLPKLLGATSARTNPELQSQVRGMIESAAVAAITAAVEAMMARPDSTADLARASCPVLIMTGAEDVLTPVSDAEAMQQHAVRSHLVVLPDAGHLSSMEAPDAFSKAMTDFLKSNI